MVNIYNLQGLRNKLDNEEVEEENVSFKLKENGRGLGILEIQV